MIDVTITGADDAVDPVELAKLSAQYTRSLFSVGILVQAKNLAVNVSADKHNFAAAEPVAFRHRARLCYLVSEPDEVIPELPPGSVLFPDYPLRGRELPIANEHPWWQGLSQDQKRMVCPADFYGQSESARCGPCKHCLKPVSGRERFGGEANDNGSSGV